MGIRLLKGSGCCFGHLGYTALSCPCVHSALLVYLAGSCGTGARDGACGGAAAGAGGAVAWRHAAEEQPRAGRRVGGQVRGEGRRVGAMQQGRAPDLLGGAQQLQYDANSRSCTKAPLAP